MGSVIFWSVVAVSAFFGKLAGEFIAPHVRPEKMHLLIWRKIGIGITVFLILFFMPVHTGMIIDCPHHQIQTDPLPPIARLTMPLAYSRKSNFRLPRRLSGQTVDFVGKSDFLGKALSGAGAS
jgi:hypothetical protein